MRTKPIQDKTGKLFGNLTAISYLGNRFWLCRCSCGKEVRADGRDLVRGKRKSCGCLALSLESREKSSLRMKKFREDNPLLSTVHGGYQLVEYGVWENMKARCYNEKNQEYKNYGARGIAISKEWLNDFGQFFKDMGPRPEGYTIDRIDTNQGYNRHNCRWITQQDNNRNKRNSWRVTIDGKEKHLYDILEELNFLKEEATQNERKRFGQLWSYYLKTGKSFKQFLDTISKG